MKLRNLRHRSLFLLLSFGSFLFSWLGHHQASWGFSLSEYLNALQNPQDGVIFNPEAGEPWLIFGLIILAFGLLCLSLCFLGALLLGLKNLVVYFWRLSQSKAAR